MVEWFLIGAVAAVGLFIGLSMLILGRLMGPAPSARKEKLSTYECGVPLLGSSREQIVVRYYLIAILFVLFDIETVFLIPWVVVYQGLGVAGLIEMFVFLGVLGYGLLYAWRRGALEWN